EEGAPCDPLGGIDSSGAGRGDRRWANQGRPSRSHGGDGRRFHLGFGARSLVGADSGLLAHNLPSYQRVASVGCEASLAAENVASCVKFGRNTTSTTANIPL